VSSKNTCIPKSVQIFNLKFESYFEANVFRVKIRVSDSDRITIRVLGSLGL